MPCILMLLSSTIKLDILALEHQLYIISIHSLHIIMNKTKVSFLECCEGQVIVESTIEYLRLTPYQYQPIL